MLTHGLVQHVRRDLFPVVAGKDPRIGDRTAPDHDRVTVGVLLHSLDIGHAAHVTRAEYRDPDRGLHFGNRVPIRIPAVALLLGPPVDSDQRTSVFFHNTGDQFVVLIPVPT